MTSRGSIPEAVARFRYSAAKVDRPLRGRWQRTQLRLAELIVSGFAALPFSIARRSGRSTLRSSEWNTWREHYLRHDRSYAPGLRIIGKKLLRRGGRTPSRGLETANQKDTSQPSRGPCGFDLRAHCVLLLARN